MRRVSKSYLEIKKNPDKFDYDYSDCYRRREDLAGQEIKSVMILEKRLYLGYTNLRYQSKYRRAYMEKGCK